MMKMDYLRCVNDVMIGRDAFDEKTPIDGLHTITLNVAPASQLVASGTIALSNGEESMKSIATDDLTLGDVHRDPWGIF